MRIAQVSLLHDAVAPWPSSNAGRAASYLIEELVSEGHEVTVFSSDDWQTSAQFQRTVASVQRRAADFDIIHLHIDRLDFLSPTDPAGPTVATLHAPCAIPEWTHSEMALIPTSRRQAGSTGNDSRKPIEPGLPRNLHEFRARQGAHLAFNGPISCDSGIQCAVEIAARAGLRLKVACEVGDARALLATRDRSGAFDLQTIEALACGTPVIAWADTAAADIIQDGVTGFVVRSTDEAVGAVARTAELDRHACRQLFEERFDVRRMTSEYLSLYRSVIHAYDCAAVTVASCLRGSRHSIIRWRPSWKERS